ncbi:MAG: carboxypeptidase-like regulatory domain-containing protein [Maioricimonas sp. JB049]
MRIRSFVAICVLCLAAGCRGGAGDEPDLVLQPVTGTVKVDGQAAEGVSVTFVPADGAGPEQVAASGTTDSTGQFTLSVSPDEEGVPAGKYRVLVTKIVKPDGTPLGPDEMAADAGAENVLPPVYQDPAQTPLGADVPEGGKSFEFEVKGS